MCEREWCKVGFEATALVAVVCGGVCRCRGILPRLSCVWLGAHSNDVVTTASEAASKATTDPALGEWKRRMIIIRYTCNTLFPSLWYCVGSVPGPLQRSSAASMHQIQHRRGHSCVHVLANAGAIRDAVFMVTSLHDSCQGWQTCSLAECRGWNPCSTLYACLCCMSVFGLSMLPTSCGTLSVGLSVHHTRCPPWHAHLRVSLKAVDAECLACVRQGSGRELAMQSWSPAQSQWVLLVVFTACMLSLNVYGQCFDASFWLRQVHS